MMHEKALDAALAVMAEGLSLGGLCEDDRRCAARAIAAFFREWSPTDAARMDALHWYDRASSGIDSDDPIMAGIEAAARTTADELEGKA